MAEYRASFDASVSFANGGGLAVHGFRVDVPDAGIGEAGIAALFVASLGLLMTESVSLSNVEVFAEPHKGTRGGPSDQSAVVVRVTGTPQRGIDVGALAALDVRGAAVLLHTGDDTRFGTPAYAEDGHFLTEAGATWLAGHQAARWASTRSTSTTPGTGGALRTRCCWRRGSPWSST
jgi:hypothetical protein